MKLIFIDEVEQPHKAPGFFGIGALIVTSTFYRGLKEDVEDAFDKAGWDQDEEFKGRYLFSSSKGDTDVGVDARIELVRSIVKGTTAAKNARAMFCLAFNYEGRTEANYLALAGQAPSDELFAEAGRLVAPIPESSCPALASAARFAWPAANPTPCCCCAVLKACP